ncbi:MAG TPA: class I SAM-dependent methyltransferase [Pseudonocardiaceae bacterium]|nr:class I SAM-dependent methyltransferase [Pseudonocardiaceae bacterium]
MTTSSASWIAAVRARESDRTDRLFDDPFARELAGERGVAMMAASERATGGENSFIPVRVRWFDDLVTSTGSWWATSPTGSARRCATTGSTLAHRHSGWAEGVFFYLTEPMIGRLLRDAASRSGPGSVFAADVIGTVGLDSPAMRPYRTWCADNGVPPPFGTDDPEALCTAGGWRVDHITAPGAPDANYGRLRDRPAGFVPGRTHLVTAEPAG